LIGETGENRRKRGREFPMAARKKAAATARKKTAPKKAVRKKAAPKKAARKKTAKTTARKPSSAASRMEQEFPATLGDFSRRVRRQLNALERNIEKTEWRYRRQATRALRDASHQLGKFEARGERAWKKLTTQARREALTVLRRVERAVEGPKPKPKKKAAAKGSSRKSATRRRPSSLESSGSGI
jgi:adenylate kinase